VVFLLAALVEALDFFLMELVEGAAVVHRFAYWE
jgi:hypothetical protein